MAISTADLKLWIRGCATLIEAQREHLSELDAAIGDADHGTNLARGFLAAAQKAEAMPTDEKPAVLFKAVAMTLMSAVGGASGMLYGSFFLRASAACCEQDLLEADVLATVLRAGMDGIVQRGRAEVGDKTMIDAWSPALLALEAGLRVGETLEAALRAGAHAAAQGARDTIPVQARKGRASYLGPRSVGHEDPGAASTALIWLALADVAISAVSADTPSMQSSS
jgi:dihydroxyacetone kinase-like protein